MLLLSSATRILATEHPPTILDPRGPHLARGHTKWPTPMYWSIRWIARQSQQGRCVSEVNTRVWTPANRPMAPKNKERGRTRPHTLCFSGSLAPLQKLTRGLFFLLVDSFLPFPLVPSCAVAASVLAVSVA